MSRQDRNKHTAKVLDMTEGSPASLLLRFSLPLVCGNLFQQAYTFADTIIAGQKLGVHALAALGASEWLTFMMFGLIQGMTQGFSIGVSKYFGTGREDMVQKEIFHAFCLSIGGALLFTIFGQMLLAPMLRILHTPDELFPMTYLYLKILYMGIPISFAYNMLAGILRAFGNSAAPLRAMMTASLGNIILDIILVVWLETGIAGAAFATLLAQLASAVYCALALSKIRQARVERDNRKWSREMFIEQIKLGIPMGFQNVITAVGGLMVQSVVNGFGILFIAGYTAANKLYGLLEIAASSYGYGISTYTAQNIGAGKKERVRTGLASALKIGSITAALMSLIMVIGGKQILGLFIKAEQGTAEAALLTGYHFLCVLAVFFPFLYILYILRACIQGMGNSVIPMLSSLIQVFMRIVCALWLTRIIGNTGIYWGEVAAWLGADVFLLFFLIRRTDSDCK